MAHTSQKRGYWVTVKSDRDVLALDGVARVGKITITAIKTSGRRRPRVLVKVHVPKDSTAQVKRRRPKKVNLAPTNRKQRALARAPREQRFFR